MISSRLATWAYAASNSLPFSLPADSSVMYAFISLSMSARIFSIAADRSAATRVSVLTSNPSCPNSVSSWGTMSATCLASAVHLPVLRSVRSSSFRARAFPSAIAFKSASASRARRSSSVFSFVSLSRSRVSDARSFNSSSAMRSFCSIAIDARSNVPAVVECSSVLARTVSASRASDSSNAMNLLFSDCSCARNALICSLTMSHSRRILSGTWAIESSSAAVRVRSASTASRSSMSELVLVLAPSAVARMSSIRVRSDRTSSASSDTSALADAIAGAIKRSCSSSTSSSRFFAAFLNRVAS
mmetsp:Transcript_7685/g.31137  ORF Transcript_7685/g.31137 Transcript_7685/m.31137 type:complete len:302 (-) Transcript_7685:3-908(-)